MQLVLEDLQQFSSLINVWMFRVELSVCVIICPLRHMLPVSHFPRVMQT
jgi:hypothetical protein